MCSFQIHFQKSITIHNLNILRSPKSKIIHLFFFPSSFTRIYTHIYFDAQRQVALFCTCFCICGAKNTTKCLVTVKTALYIVGPLKN